MYFRQPPDLELTPRRRVVIFGIGVLESMLFAGTVFGWPQLVHVLKVEGLYGDLCQRNLTSVTPSASSASVAPLYVPVSPSYPAVPLSSSPYSPDSVVNDSMLQFSPFAPSPSSGIVSSTQSSPVTIFDSQYENTTLDISKGPSVEACGPQDEMFALIFTLTVGCYSCPGVIIGYLLHHAGLRITRISAGTMMTMSFLFLAAATKESPNYLFPAMILMALGGNQLRMSVMQFGDLFPRHRSTAITLLSGMYAASGALFLLFQYTAMAGIDRAHVCWGLACASGFTIIVTFIMPLHHIPVKEMQSNGQVKVESSPLSRSVWSLSSFLHQAWFFVGLFTINLYQQSYNVWTNMSSSSVEEVAIYSMLYSYSNLITVFFGPIGGAFTDFLVRRGRKIPNVLDRRVKEIQASFWPLLFTTLATGVMYACKFFMTTTAIYLSLLCMVVARPCVIAVSTAYLRIRFPADHFNRVLGIYGTITSLLMFLQYPVFVWSQHMYYIANGTIVALVILSLANPLHLMITPLMKRAVVARDSLTTDGTQEEPYHHHHHQQETDEARVDRDARNGHVKELEDKDSEEEAVVKPLV